MSEKKHGKPKGPRGAGSGLTQGMDSAIVTFPSPKSNCRLYRSHPSFTGPGLVVSRKKRSHKVQILVPAPPVRQGLAELAEALVTQLREGDGAMDERTRTALAALSAELRSLEPVLASSHGPTSVLDLFSDTSGHDDQHEGDVLCPPAPSPFAAHGTLSSTEVAERLGLTRQAVNDRLRNGRLVAWRTARGNRYPAWQFVGSEVVPGLEDFLQRLPEHAQQIAGDLLVRDQPELGTSPLAALLAGRLAEVVSFAESYGEHGAA